MSDGLSGRVRERAWFAVALALVAGFVDAASFISIAHVFTAHMSGNTAAFGAYIGRGEWEDAIRRLLPVPLFCGGVFFASVVSELATRRGLRTRTALLLGIEALLLCAIAVAAGVGWGHVSSQTFEYIVMNLPAFAIGVQSVALRKVGGRTVRTAFITGMLATMTEEWVRFLMRRDRRHRPPAARPLLLGFIWCAFCSGAAVGGLCYAVWHSMSLLAPTAALVCIVVVSLIDSKGPMAERDADANGRDSEHSAESGNSHPRR